MGSWGVFPATQSQVWIIVSLEKTGAIGRFKSGSRTWGPQRGTDLHSKFLLSELSDSWPRQTNLCWIKGIESQKGWVWEFGWLGNSQVWRRLHREGCRGWHLLLPLPEVRMSSHGKSWIFPASTTNRSMMSPGTASPGRACETAKWTQSAGTFSAGPRGLCTQLSWSIVLSSSSPIPTSPPPGASGILFQGTQLHHGDRGLQT